jgi:hypothetical protein
MEVTVTKVSLEEFNVIAEDVHKGCFQEMRPKEMNRFDYALLTSTEKNGLTSYSTILEHDSASAYMQHGGTFHPDNKMLTTKSYLKMIEWLKGHYPVLTTRIFNWNVSMIKLALQAGFLIHGVEYYHDTENFKGGILLNLKLEVGHEQ